MLAAQSEEPIPHLRRHRWHVASTFLFSVHNTTTRGSITILSCPIFSLGMFQACVNRRSASMHALTTASMLQTPRDTSGSSSTHQQHDYLAPRPNPAFPSSCLLQAYYSTHKPCSDRTFYDHTIGSNHITHSALQQQLLPPPPPLPPTPPPPLQAVPLYYTAE